MVMEPVLVLDRLSGHLWLCDALRLFRGHRSLESESIKFCGSSSSPAASDPQQSNQKSAGNARRDFVFFEMCRRFSYEVVFFTMYGVVLATS